MSSNLCPFCHTSVPHGATVCTGCHAELEYGPPNVYFVVAAIAGIFLGVKLSDATGISGLGWAAGVATFVGGSLWVNKMFAHRVVFRRVSKTR